MTALYVCYQSIREPLTQTQVIAYLEGLALAGYRIVLLTFEPQPLTAEQEKHWCDKLAGKGILWHWLRYHKRPTVPATAWDVLAGIIAGRRLAIRYQVSLLHARSHVPGIIALALKHLTGAKLLFDLRGFMAEEYAEAGVWPADGLLFRTTKRVERKLVKAADGIVVLTHKAEAMLRQWYPRESQGKLIHVIPCCVDLRRYPCPRESEDGSPNIGKDTTMAYVGKLGGWYLTEAMVAFVAAAGRIIPHLRWRVWTQNAPSSFRRLLESNGLNGNVFVGRTSPEALPEELGKSQVGLSFVKTSLSKRASSPTKIGEYLAAGLPVVSTAGIGDVDQLLAGNGDGPVGVLVRDDSPAGYERAARELADLLAQPRIRERCRRVAQAFLDLERVGWPKYRAVYESLSARSDKIGY